MRRMRNVKESTMLTHTDALNVSLDNSTNGMMMWATHAGL